MKMPSLQSIVILYCIVLLSSCASMFNGTSQQVAIRSNVEGAELYVNDTFIGKDNTVVAFKKKEDYVITARKEGCVQASVGATKSFDATTLLGILIDFGLVSILVVDGLATGAWQSFDQTSYVVDPNCS